MSRKKTIFEWFNPADINHIKAYGILCKHGCWPDGFIPEYVTFTNAWAFDVAYKIAKYYTDQILTDAGQCTGNTQGS